MPVLGEYAYQTISQMSVAPHPPGVGHACVSGYVRMYVHSISCSHTSHPLGCFFHLACINNYISTCYKFGSVI